MPIFYLHKRSLSSEREQKYIAKVNKNTRWDRSEPTIETSPQYDASKWFILIFKILGFTFTVKLLREIVEIFVLFTVLESAHEEF